jgi:hypothetical protein
MIKQPATTAGYYSRLLMSRPRLRAIPGSDEVALAMGPPFDVVIA